jgi:signal transduction histidine kinase
VSRRSGDRELFGLPRVDLALVTFLVVLFQLQIWLSRDLVWVREGRWTTAVLVFVAAGSLAFRRTQPLAAYLVNTAALVAVSFLGVPGLAFTVFALNLVGIYSVAAYGSNRHQWISVAPAVGVLAVYFIAVTEFGGLMEAALVVSLWSGAWLAGRLYGSRVRELDLMRQRDATATSLAEERARLVVEEERNRLAREIHDLLGHTLNVIVMHAGAGRLAVDKNRMKIRGVLNTIEETGRAAMGELDNLLDQMNSGAEVDDHPVPGIGDLDELSTRIAAAELPVNLEIDGDVSAVPPGVSFAIYRVVQEAMTNTMRHANASEAEVSVSVTEHSVDVFVTDDGNELGEVIPGRGLSGARERFLLHGGTLQWRSHESGGLTLEGHIPLAKRDD